MATFSLANFYTNRSQWNEEFLIDGILYVNNTGSFFYLFTTTGIFRYIYNDQSNKADYGVINRDVAYVCYEIPSNKFGPYTLGATVGFINRNGIFCALNMIDGTVRRFAGWFFDKDSVGTNSQIWGFVAQPGNALFVVGNNIVDATYKDSDNYCAGVSALCVSGFYKFVGDGKKLEICLLRGEIKSAVSGNFFQGGISLKYVFINKNDYGASYYVRYAGSKEVISAEEGKRLLEEYFFVKDDVTSNTYRVPINCIFNTSSEKNDGSFTYEDKPSFFTIGFDMIHMNMPLLINPLPNLVKVPKITVGFSGLYISSFTSYLSSSKDPNKVSDYMLRATINGEEVINISVLDDASGTDKETGWDKDSFSDTMNVAIATRNSSAASLKIEVFIEQVAYIEGFGKQKIAMSDSIYVNPINVSYSLFQNT